VTLTCRPEKTPELTFIYSAISNPAPTPIEQSFGFGIVCVSFAFLNQKHQIKTQLESDSSSLLECEQVDSIQRNSIFNEDSDGNLMMEVNQFKLNF
jgi:hypothetical protein